MFCPRNQLIKQQCGPTLTKYVVFVQHLSPNIVKVQEHHDLKLLPMPSAFQTAISSGHRLSLAKSSGGIASKDVRNGRGIWKAAQ